ncbi:hypothetical protein GCM10027589_06140 [Actinocorallia lasiicapitis]
MSRTTRTPGINVKWAIIGLIAAVGVGLMLTLQVRNWIALGVESGGSCGSSRGISSGPCPQSWGTIFGLSLASLFLFVPLVFMALVKAGRIGCVAGAVAAAVGVYPGILLFDAMHGRTIEAAWSLPSDTGSDTDTEGVWASGETVVRARFDGLTAYQAGSGERRWNWQLPGRDVLCGLSRTADGGVGLVARQSPDAGLCGTTTALDLVTGKVLWEHTVATEDLSAGTEFDRLALAGDSALVRTSRLVQALGVKDGAVRWKRTPKSPRCLFGWIAGGTDRTVVAERCHDTDAATHVLRSLDPATGRELWSLRIPAVGNANVSFVSAEPLVVRVQETDQRGTTSLLSINGEGRVIATIPVDESDAKIEDDPLGSRSVIPVYRIAVTKDTLVAKTRNTRGENRLTAYSLTDGHRLWQSPKGRDTIAFVAYDGKEVLTATARSGLLRLRALDPATGKERVSAAVPLDYLDSGSQLIPTPSALIVAAGSGHAPYSPLQGLPRP